MHLLMKALILVLLLAHRSFELRRKPVSPIESTAAAVAPRFYSVAQVAQMLGMSAMTVYRAISAGEFPAVRIRGRLIVPAKAIDEMAEVAMTERTVVDAAGWVALVPAPARAREA